MYNFSVVARRTFVLEINMEIFEFNWLFEKARGKRIFNDLLISMKTLRYIVIRIVFLLQR